MAYRPCVMSVPLCQTFLQWESSRRCSYACAVLSLCPPPRARQLQTAAACGPGRGGASVWPASISAKRVDSRGQAFSTVALAVFRWRGSPWTARGRMRIVDIVCRHREAEEGEVTQKVSSDDGWYDSVSTKLVTPHSLYNYWRWKCSYVGGHKIHVAWVSLSGHFVFLQLAKSTTHQ